MAKDVRARGLCIGAFWYIPGIFNETLVVPSCDVLFYVS